jgi:hypothetical protein
MLKGTRVSLSCNRTGQIMTGTVITERQLSSGDHGLFVALSPDRWRWFNLNEWRII